MSSPENADQSPAPEDPQPEPAEEATPDLDADLETVREVTGKAYDSEQTINVLRSRVDELEAGYDLIEATAAQRIDELERRLRAAVRPVTVTQAELGTLSDTEIMQVIRTRARAAAMVLDEARYKGTSTEVWDLLQVFPSRVTDPVLVASARALLGQE